MKRILALLMTGMVSGASAVSLIDTDFTDYSAGNIAGQKGWVQMPNTGAYSFEVDPSPGVADTAPYESHFYDGTETNGHYIYQSASFSSDVDDQWAGVMDFSLSTSAYAGTNIALLGKKQEIYQIGLTCAATNKLSSTDQDDITIHFRRQTDTLSITLSSTGKHYTLAQLSDSDIGWAPNSTNAPDFDTDDLRLTWTLRKTRTDGVFSAWVTLSNKTTGAVSEFDPDLNAPEDNNYYASRTNAYAASSLYLAMGHNADAGNKGNSSIINIALDSLSVDQSSGNVPVLPAPEVAVENGNEVVTLSWSASPDATSYTIKRSTVSGGPYSSIGTTNGTSFADTTVVNDSLYYYIVTATSTGAADADSDEVTGEPQAAATGSIVSTTFVSSEGYADGDLAGQDRWKGAANGANPVFDVTDMSGAGFADSAPNAGSYDSNLVNDVYFNRPMSNNVGDEWTGSLTFQVTAPATPGEQVIRTFDLKDESGNVVGSFTGTNDIASIYTSDLFKIGLSTHPDDGLSLEGSDGGVFLVVRTRKGPGLKFVFVSDGVSDNLTELDRTSAGWDPNWQNDGNDATNGPDSVTDPITLNWKIRKPSTTNLYLATLEVMTSSITNTVTVPLSLASADTYAAGLVYFEMGIADGAQKGTHVSEDGTKTVIQTATKSIAIDSLSLTKADDQPPVKQATDLSGVALDGSTIALKWDPLIEVESYQVLSSEVDGGPYAELTNGVVDLVYTNGGLTNMRTYFHVVRAYYGSRYGYGPYSEQTILRPLDVVKIAGWGKNADITDTINWIMDHVSVTNGATYNRTGNGPDGALLYDGWGDYNINAAPPVYGIMQAHMNTEEGFAFCGLDRKTPVDGMDYICIRRGDKNEDQINLFLYSKTTTSVDATAKTIALELELAETGQAKYNTDFSAGGQVHAMVQNGSQWYISETVLDGTSGLEMSIPDLSAEKWLAFTMPTMASTDVFTAMDETSYVQVSLDNITAVGCFADRCKTVSIVKWNLLSGQQLSPLMKWTDSFGIYNDDADAGADPDGDGVVNVHEWGTMGDPTDPENNGRQDLTLGLDETGTNLVYIYPRLESSTRPTYTVLNTTDLIYDTWSAASNVVEVGVGLWDTNNPSLGLDAVTNLVPVDEDSTSKFIGLEITE